MNDQEAKRVKAWTQDMTTRCVGRSVIELPQAFVLNSESETTVDGIRVQVEPQAKKLIDARLESRHNALVNATLLGSKAKILNRIVELPDGTGIVFDRARTDESNILRTHELWAWRDGFSIYALADARDMSFGDAQDGRATDTAEVFGNLMRLQSRIRGRRIDEIPTEVGTCIANGFISGPAAEAETIQMAFHLQGSRDVYFNFVSWTDLRETDSLLERSAKVEREMKASGTTTVRKGKQSLHGQAWEEWLFRGPTPERVHGHMFSMKANEKTGSPQTPHLTWELFNGFDIPHPVRSPEESAKIAALSNATLSEAEAVALWDAVIATIRPR
jgi:hypothetical protein